MWPHVSLVVVLGLAGVISVILMDMEILSMLSRLVLQSCGSGAEFRGATLESASAMTFSLPQRYSMCTSYWASLRSSLCSLGLEVAIVFFHMLVSSWWSVSTVIDFSKCIVMQPFEPKDYTK